MTLKHKIKSENLLERYFISIKHTHQYAEGVCGSHGNLLIWDNNGEGFATKAEVKKLFKELNKDGKFKTFIINEAKKLGHYYRVSLLTGDELLDEIDCYNDMNIIYK